MTTTTQGEHAQTEALRPKFGDLLRNTMASEGNPRRDAYFIREVHRSGGGVNPGRWFEMTDGKGETWLSNPQNLVPAATAQPAAPQGVAKVNWWEADGDKYDDSITRAQPDPTAQAAPAATDPAYSEACSLATALFEKHYRQEPDYASGRVVWSLCDTTAGVISQIDNMVSGLARAPAAGAVAAPSEADQEEVEAVIACLGDDAATLREQNPECEMAANMDRAAELLAAAPIPAAQADSVLEDAAPQAAIENPYRAMTGRHEAFEQGVLKTLAAFRAKHAARKQGGAQ